MPTLIELLKKGQNVSFKSLIDRMLDRPAFDNSEYNKLGLSGPPTRVGDIASMAIDAMPGIGDISSALKVPDNLRNKEYGQAALNSLGALPMVAGVGAIRNPAKSTVVQLEGPDFMRDDMEIGGVSKLSLDLYDRIINKYNRIFGTVRDPIYKAIDSGVIGDEKTLYDVANALKLDLSTVGEPVRQRFQRRANMVGVPKRIAESEYMSPEALTDFVRQEQGTELQTSNPTLEDIYDFSILGNNNVMTKGYLENLLQSRGLSLFSDNSISDFEALNTEFFRKAPSNHLVFESSPGLILPLEALDYALANNWVIPQSIRDGKIGIPEILKYQDRYDKYLTSNEIRNRFEPQFEFDGGHKWVELKDKDALIAEGKLMNNCVGGYCDAVADGTTRIFSLRSPTNKSILNAEVNADGEIVQMSANSNQPIKKEHIPYVNEFEYLYKHW